MIKQSIWALTIVVGCVLRAESQVPSFSTSIGNKIDMKPTGAINLSVMGADDNENLYYIDSRIPSLFGMMGNQKTSYNINKVDKSMNLLTRNELKNMPAAKGHALGGFSLFPLRTTEEKFFYLVFDGESGDHMIVKSIEVDKTTGNLNMNNAQTVATTYKPRGFYNHVEKWADHEVISSPDSSTFAVFTYAENFGDEGGWFSDLFHASIFNKEMKIRWENDIQVPLAAKQYRIAANCLDKEGNLFLLLMTGEKQALSNDPGFIDFSKVQWKVLKANGGDVKIYDVKVKDGDISFANLVNTSQGLTISGIYSNGKAENVKGFFSIKMDGSGNILSQNTKEVDGKFFPSNVKPDPTKNFVWEHWYTLRMSDITPLKDGGFLWTAEPRFRWSATGRQTSVTQYLDMDEFCVRINPDNSIAYVTKIPKKQIYYSDKPVPTKSFVDNDILYVLYLDNPENINITDNSSIKPLDGQQLKPNLVLAKVNFDGSYKKEVVLTSEKSSEYFAPIYMQKIKPGSYFLPVMIAEGGVNNPTLASGTSGNGQVPVTLPISSYRAMKITLSKP